MTLEGAKKALRKAPSESGVDRDAELMERLQRIRALLVEVREDLKAGEGEIVTASDADMTDADASAAAAADTAAAAETPGAPSPGQGRGEDRRTVGRCRRESRRGFLGSSLPSNATSAGPAARRRRPKPKSCSRFTNNPYFEHCP